MAARVKKIAGHKVEIWTTSFRIEGMSRAVWVGPHITDEMIEQMIRAIHMTIFARAEKQGRRRAADAVTRKINKLIMEA